MTADRAVGRALAWAGAVTVVEAVARRALPGRRAAAWAVAYAGLGAVALAAGRRSPSPATASAGGAASAAAGGAATAAVGVGPGGAAGGGAAAAVGVALAVAGYPTGRALLGDRPTGPPPDGLAVEAAVLAGVVAPVEELVWGSLVEPALGVPATAVLFATKHVAVDGRWRRGLGLALFWTGLGLVRRRSPVAAVALHVAANVGAVALGHATGRDRF